LGEDADALGGGVLAGTESSSESLSESESELEEEEEEELDEECDESASESGDSSDAFEGGAFDLFASLPLEVSAVDVAALSSF
jgi:hypothetical protein